MSFLQSQSSSVAPFDGFSSRSANTRDLLSHLLNRTYVGRISTTLALVFPVTALVDLVVEFSAYVDVTISEHARVTSAEAAENIASDLDVSALVGYIHGLTLTGTVNEKFVLSVIESCPKLKSLKLNASLSELTFRGLEACMHLEQLHIERDVRIHENEISSLILMRALTLKRISCSMSSSIAQALSSCRNLQYLRIVGLFQANLDLSPLSVQCVALVSLNLSGVNGVTDDSIAPLLSTCRLERLILAKCPRITDATLTAIAKSQTCCITTLMLLECTGLTDNGIKVLAATQSSPSPTSPLKSSSSSSLSSSSPSSASSSSSSSLSSLASTPAIVSRSPRSVLSLVSFLSLTLPQLTDASLLVICRAFSMAPVSLSVTGCTGFTESGFNALLSAPNGRLDVLYAPNIIHRTSPGFVGHSELVATPLKVLERRRTPSQQLRSRTSSNEQTTAVCV